MGDADRVAIDHFTFTHKKGEYHQVVVSAGTCTTERIVPPAGGDHAFDVTRWSNRVEVCVSPTGRSVQVFVNGRKIR